jgi:hypothetical protein
MVGFMAKLAVVSEAAEGPMAVLVGDYLASCKARGLSPNTLQNSYGYPLRKVLLPFCDRENIADVSGLTSRALDRLAGGLLDNGGERGPLSRHSVHAYMRAINHFLVWAKREGEPVEAKTQLPKLHGPVYEHRSAGIEGGFPRGGAANGEVRGRPRARLGEVLPHRGDEGRVPAGRF